MYFATRPRVPLVEERRVAFPEDEVASLDYGVASLDYGVASLDDGVTSMEDNSVASLKDDGVALLIKGRWSLFAGQRQY